MSKRNVKRISTALAHTSRPVAADSRIGDGLENFVAGLGTMSDKRSYNSWGPTRFMTRTELEAMFGSSWLAKRIITTVADDMTGNWRDFTLGDDDTNPNLDALRNAEKTLQVKAKVNEATTWGRLYGGCLLIMGTADAIDPIDWKNPLDVTKVKKGDLKWVKVLDRWRVSPSGQMETDLNSPNHGMPVSYIIAESSIEVHHSRVIRFGGERLPYFEWLRNARWDAPVLQHVLDSINDYSAVARSIATMMFEANVDVIKSDDITELLASKSGEEKLRRRFAAAALMKSFNRTFLLDKEEEYEKKQNSFTNLKDIWMQFAVDVCGACDIPMTRLFGQAPGGLNSTGDGDLQNYYKMIASKQESTLRPQLDYFDQVFVRSTLGAIPDDYKFTFNSLWETSDKDQAAIEYQRAQRDQIYQQIGSVTEGLIASELKRRGTYASMSDEDVELAKELSEQTQEARELGFEAQKQGATEPDQGDESDSKPPNGKGKKPPEGE